MNLKRHYKSQHRNKQKEYNPKWLNVSGLMFAAISAIAAAVAVIQTYNLWLKQEEIQRPYFTLIRPHVEPNSDSTKYQFVVSFNNEGARPAYNFSTEILLFKHPIFDSIFKSLKTTSANPIAPIDSPTVRVIMDSISPNIPIHYIYIKLQSYDQLLEINRTQEFYLIWDGVKNKKGFDRVDHMSISDKDNLIQKINKFIQ